MSGLVVVYEKCALPAVFNQIANEEKEAAGIRYAAKK